MKQATKEDIARAFDRAAKFIEQGWTRKAHARNRRNQAVYPDSLEAVKWGMSGALYKAQIEMDLPKPLDGFLCMVAKELLGVVPMEYNDAPDRTSREVANFLRRVARHIKTGKRDVSLYLGRWRGRKLR